MLFIFGTISDQALNTIQEKIDVSVYLRQDADEIQVAKLQKELKALPEVTSVTYVSPDEALAEFQAQNKDDTTIIQALEELGENPLGATLVVKAASGEDYEKVIDVINQDSYSTIIDSKHIQDYQKVITEVNNIAVQGRRIGLIVSVLFIIIALLVAINTIRIAIYTHRQEIQIMKLVGANNRFIELPFLTEGIYIAIISSLITTGLLFPLIQAIAPYVDTFFAGFMSFNLLQYFYQNWWQFLLTQLAVAVTICVISTGWAIRRYLKI